MFQVKNKGKYSKKLKESPILLSKQARQAAIGGAREEPVSMG